MTETPAQPPSGSQQGDVSSPTPAAQRVSAGGDSAVRFDQALIAVGVALLSATVVMATTYSRVGGDLDASNFIMGLAATVGLLGIAGAARILVRDQVRSSELMAWPGAFGAVAAGLMVAVLMDDHALTGYFAGGVVLVLSATGYYLLVRRGAFVVSAILGVFAVYTALFSDIFDATDIEGDNPGVIVGAGVLGFALLVTAAGWLLPETRVLSSVVVGVIAVLSNASILVGLALVAMFARAFGAGFTGLEGDGNGVVESQSTNAYSNDAWLVLGFSLLLVAGWAYLTYVTGHVAFPLLMAAMCASVIPLVTVVVAAGRPTWWEVVVGLVGGAVLVLAAGRAMGARKTP